MTTATYSRLRDGSWGLRVLGAASPGAVVEAQKKSGEMKSEKVGRVLWTGRDKTGQTVSLCEIARGGAAYDPQRFNGYGARRGGYVRECKTGGNCSSVGSGRSCGGHDCDGY